MYRLTNIRLSIEVHICICLVRHPVSCLPKKSSLQRKIFIHLIFSLFCSILECPRSPDHMERFACPRPDRRGRFRCIDDRALCDGFYDCPDKEDENPDHCLFYKTVSISTERIRIFGSRVTLKRL